MKRLIVLAVLLSVVGVGCSAPVVFTRALEPPKWPVASSRTIGVVAILEDKRGREAQLTRDIATLLKKGLKQSAYYTKVARAELPTGDFSVGQSSEKVPVEQTIKTQARELGVDLLLFVEVLQSDVQIGLGQAGFGFGIGRTYGRTTFSTTIGSGSSYWNAGCHILVSLLLAGADKGSVIAGDVNWHTIARSYSHSFPSETNLLQEVAERFTARALTFVDVYFHPAPRHLRYGGTALTADGVQFAMLGSQRDWQAAEESQRDWQAAEESQRDWQAAEESQRDWQAAEELWRRAHAQNPDSLAANYNLAVAAEMRKDYAAAAPLYKRAAELFGRPGAFEREIYESSRSAEVLAKFGAPEETKKPPEKQPLEPAKEPEPKPTPEKPEPAPQK